MARAGEEDLELHYMVKFGPPQAAGTVYFAMDVDDVPAALASRPNRLSEVRPQEWAQRRNVQQIVDPVPLPTLDDPAPQMVEQLPDLLHFFDALSPDPEQAIEVPKILPVDVPMRTPLRDTQLAEQLVEVPTIVSYSWLQLRMGSSSSTRFYLIPGRLSKCPKSCLTMFRCEPRLASRSWWNSWWKCRRSYLGPCCS